MSPGEARCEPSRGSVSFILRRGKDEIWVFSFLWERVHTHTHMDSQCDRGGKAHLPAVVVSRAAIAAVFLFLSSCGGGSVLKKPTFAPNSNAFSLSFGEKSVSTPGGVWANTFGGEGG